MGVLRESSAATAIVSSSADVSFRLNVDSCINANNKESMNRCGETGCDLIVTAPRLGMIGMTPPTWFSLVLVQMAASHTRARTGRACVPKQRDDDAPSTSWLLP